MPNYCITMMMHISAEGEEFRREAGERMKKVGVPPFLTSAP